MSSAAARFGPHLRELRIHLCQKSGASRGVREFMERHYVPLKKQNPQFPILVRECSGIMPKVWARYEFGKETSVALENKSSDEVLNVLTQLASSKGAPQ